MKINFKPFFVLDKIKRARPISSIFLKGYLNHILGQAF